MNTKVNLQSILIVFMICVTVFISTNTYVNAQNGGPTSASENTPVSEILVDPVPGGPGFIMVSAYEFKPFVSTYEWAHGGTDLYSTSTTQASYFEAGVTLPHGATITKVTFYYYDNSSLNMSFYLCSASAEGNATNLAIVQSEGAQTVYRTVSQTSITNPIVDNQNFSYFLEIYFPQNGLSNLKLMNVRIDYGYTSNLPTVMKN